MKKRIVKILYGLSLGLILSSLTAGTALAQNVRKQNETEIVLPEQSGTEMLLSEQNEAETCFFEQDEAEVLISEDNLRLPKTRIISIANTSGVKLKWKAVRGAEGYRVYRRAQGGSWHRIAQIEGRCSYLDKSCVSGIKYAYLVRAYEEVDGRIKVGEADPEERAVILRLDKPNLLEAAPTAVGNILLSWDSVPGARAYDIYQKDSSGNWKKIGATKKNMYVVKGLAKGTVGTFAAVSRKGSYQSSRGRAKSAVSLAVPTITSAVSLDQGIKLKWKKAKGADGYRIYRSASKGTWERIGKSKTASYVDEEVSLNNTYRYLIRPYKIQDGKKYFGAFTSRYAVSAEFEPPVMVMAKQRLKKVGGTLKKAFEWSAFMTYYSGQPSESNSAEYAKWSFQHEKGYCYGKASTFCYMARALGYDCWVMEGYVRNSSGGLSDHGWVEIVYKGETYVCDPSFHGRYSEKGYTGYFIKYGQKNTWQYTNYKEMDK